MLVQSAHQVPPARLFVTEKPRRPKCPGCGSVVLVAEESRFSPTGRIDHLWSCDECGDAFVTSIRLWRG